MWQGMAHTYSTSAINSLLSMKTVAEIASELTFIQINGQTTLKMDPPRYQGFYVATSPTKSASEGGKFSCRTSDQRHWYGSLRRLYPIDERLNEMISWLEGNIQILLNFDFWCEYFRTEFETLWICAEGSKYFWLDVSVVFKKYTQ